MIPNAPIGLWPGLEYEGESIDTIQGRPLFLYTDGLKRSMGNLFTFFSRLAYYLKNFI